MALTFANLAGFWALLGIPVILLIHFLQKERREVVTSTLFLLNNMQRESKSGIRLERLRNSLPLWLQILAVLLLAWLLTEPRWMRPDSFQRVVIALDSSASMEAFSDQALSRLDRHLSRTARASARTDWILLESDPRRGTLYSGENVQALRDALANWRPRSGTHDTAPALERARGLLRREGSVIFVTDHLQTNLPAGVHLLAVGYPIENCGFTGLRLEERAGELIWHVLARNYGNSPQEREWQAFFGEQTTAPRTIRLEPGQSVALSGRFPPGETEGFLVMNEDRFTLDDWLPLVRPKPKQLAIFVEDHPLMKDLAPPLTRSLPDWRPVTGRADLRIASRLPDQTHPSQPGIYFLAEPSTPERILTAPLVAENHSLMQDLNWQGLLVQAGEEEISLSETDRVLLWQAERPLIVLRQNGPNRWLLFHFDPRHSNVARLPAFVILVHRFVEQLREGKLDFERRNLQTGQTFAAAADPLGAELVFRFRDRDGAFYETVLDPVRARILNAPDEAGFLEVSQEGRPLLQAAVHFADSRQADFRGAASRENDSAVRAAVINQNTKADVLTPVWILLLGGVLITSWWITGRRDS